MYQTRLKKFKYDWLLIIFILLQVINKKKQQQQKQKAIYSKSIQHLIP